VQTPPPVLLTGVDRRADSKTGDCLFSKEKSDSAWLQEAPAFQGRSPRFSSSCGTTAAAHESRAPQRTPKGSAKSSHWSSFVLRGLPFDVTEDDVVSFIEQLGAADAVSSIQPVSLVTNPQGKPSGFAEVNLSKTSSFHEIQEKLHMQRLGGRYVEVLPPFGKGKPSPWKTAAYRNNRWSEGNKRDSWRQM
jgi:hypothetical protein